jgi:hypothetical protein
LCARHPSPNKEGGYTLVYGGRGDSDDCILSKKNESNKNKNLIISYFFVIEKMIFNMQKGTETFIQRVCKI